MLLSIWMPNFMLIEYYLLYYPQTHILRIIVICSKLETYTFYDEMTFDF